MAGGGEALLGEESQDGHGALAETCHEVVKLALGDTNHGSPPFTVVSKRPGLGFAGRWPVPARVCGCLGEGVDSRVP